MDANPVEALTAPSTAPPSAPLAEPSDLSPAKSDGVSPDLVLIKRLRDGDNSAGEMLVVRYVEPLMRYLRRLVGSEHVAEELHQQTWLSVLEHLDKFDPAVSSGGFKAWLFRIATNKANDIWRSRGREKIAIASMRLVGETEVPDASAWPDASEQEQKLLRAIQQLPENQRQVVIMRYFSELKFVEIAEILGCPLNTALGRMHKAMLKLKSLLDDSPAGTDASQKR